MRDVATSTTWSELSSSTSARSRPSGEKRTLRVVCPSARRARSRPVFVS
ncbi:MAG: hypothetical protein U0441_20905 [Polyangiaceae bacterium]